MTRHQYRAFVSSVMARVSSARAAFSARLGECALLLTSYARPSARPERKDRFRGLDLTWCLGITDWLALGVSPSHADIEDDVRSGNVSCLLSRPISYFWLRVAEGLGTLLLHVAILGVFGLAIACVLGEGMPGGTWLSLVCGALMAFVAATLNLLFSATVGIYSLFMQDTSQLSWLWQKSALVFGDPTYPLDVCPEAVRRMGFASVSCAPSRFVVSVEPGLVWQTTLVLAGWLLVAVLSAHFAFRRALKSLGINGR